MPRGESKKEAPWTILFYGPGEITEDHAADLLDNWLPRDDDTIREVILPGKLPRTGFKGLKNVRAFLEQEEQFGEDITKSDDLAATLRGLAEEKRESVYVVLLWGESGDEKSQELLELALKSGFAAKDLADGMEDLELSADDPPWDEDDPHTAKAEEPPPSRGRRGASKDKAEPAEPAEAGSGTRRTRGQPRADASAEEAEPENDQELLVERALRVTAEGCLSEESVRNMIQEELAKVLSVALKKLNLGLLSPAEQEPEKAAAPAEGGRRRGPGRPRSDGSDPEPDPHKGERKWYRDSDDNYKLAGRGRPREDAEAVWLTPEQEKKLELV